MRFLLALLLSAGLARAEGEPAGDFDYYVLSLSWSPSWCAIEGDSRRSPQCDAARNLGWVLHGLWPQFEQGWPSNCRTSQANPSRADTAAMANIMGTSGSAWHQWSKHGRCSGLSPQGYFKLAREAYGRIVLPDIFRRLKAPVRLPASVVEDAFLEANPGLSAEQIAITCKAERIQEARVCLTRSLEPRECGVDVVHDCSMTDALLEPVR